MYVCMYVCMYACIHTCMHACTHTHAHMHACTHVCTYVCVCVHSWHGQWYYSNIVHSSHDLLQGNADVHKHSVIKIQIIPSVKDWKKVERINLYLYLNVSVWFSAASYIKNMTHSCVHRSLPTHGSLTTLLIGHLTVHRKLAYINPLFPCLP